MSIVNQANKTFHSTFPNSFYKLFVEIFRMLREYVILDQYEVISKICRIMRDYVTLDQHDVIYMRASFLIHSLTFYFINS